ncbi:MAG: F0F1 ATP synthase subunit A [Candidatus Omnitrophica bacterium]|nr:F0F1 ATP synthase subunit A [Candidatus Omnitrophota bacterium]
MIAYAAETAPHAAEMAHSAAAEGGHMVPELPNLVTVLNLQFGDDPVWGPFVHLLHRWENVFFALVAIMVLTLVFRHVSRNIHQVPGRLQSFVELIVSTIEGFVVSVLGSSGRKFTPLIGTFFIYIITMNLFGVVPLLKSPTASINLTAGLALCVFVIVQGLALKSFGFLGYLYHLMGEPRDLVTWILSPLMFVIHIVGEIAKPLSLAIRLFGNITGEDALMAVFAGLGISLMALVHFPVGFPLHVLVYPLIFIFSTLQALVFSLLSTVYISMVLPHGEDH